MRGTKMLGRHATMESYKSSQVFAIAGENQHGIASGYDMNQQVEHGSSNSHTDSANSQVGFACSVTFDRCQAVSLSGTTVGLPEELERGSLLRLSLSGCSLTGIKIVQPFLLASLCRIKIFNLLGL